MDEHRCPSRLHPHLLAVSDLHVGYPENAEIVRALRPGHPQDWLLVGGDVAEFGAVVVNTLEDLARRFAQVVWVPGNHELWTNPRDDDTRRGVRRYEHLVDECRTRGILTPEDPYAHWPSIDGPLVIVPTFLLYDYSFRPPGMSEQEALARADEAGHVLTDEYLLHPDPHPDRAAWCRERVALTERRLEDLPSRTPIVIVNHYPLLQDPTNDMFSPWLPLWCGTRATASWIGRYPIRTNVYGHLHMPRSTMIDGVSFEEVSLGYPQERKRSPRHFEPRVIACGVADSS